MIHDWEKEKCLFIKETDDIFNGILKYRLVTEVSWVNAFVDNLLKILQKIDPILDYNYPSVQFLECLLKFGDVVVRLKQFQIMNFPY